METYRVKLEMNTTVEENFEYACKVYSIDPSSKRKKKTILRKIIYAFRRLHEENQSLRNQLIMKDHTIAYLESKIEKG